MSDRRKWWRKRWPSRTSKHPSSSLMSRIPAHHSLKFYNKVDTMKLNKPTMTSPWRRWYHKRRAPLVDKRVARTEELSLRRLKRLFRQAASKLKATLRIESMSRMRLQSSGLVSVNLKRLVIRAHPKLVPQSLRLRRTEVQPPQRLQQRRPRPTWSMRKVASMWLVRANQVKNSPNQAPWRTEALLGPPLRWHPVQMPPKTGALPETLRQLWLHPRWYPRTEVHLEIRLLLLLQAHLMQPRPEARPVTQLRQSLRLLPHPWLPRIRVPLDQTRQPLRLARRKPEYPPDKKEPSQITHLSRSNR